MTVQMIFAIYGAALSTGLAVLTALKFLREKPRISVEATLVNASSSEGEKTHGILHRVKRGDDLVWEEVDVEIIVRNSGALACQISDVFIETASAILQVRPNGLPVILDPNTSCSVRIQPEFLAPKKLGEGGALTDRPVESVGVFDG